jgi:uncharacterized protein YkwD
VKGTERVRRRERAARVPGLASERVVRIFAAVTKLLRFCLGIALVAGAAKARDLAVISPEAFATLPEVRAPIDIDHFDRKLLAAAIFQETNRIRRELGLVPFRHLHKLDEAAALQATMGALQVEVGHENPLHGLAQPVDRVRYVGLVPGAVAENVAQTPAVEADQGAGVEIRTEEGRRRFFDPNTGKECPPRSYLALAAQVVDQWMHSPAHRANIVDGRLEYLGCATAYKRSVKGLDLLFSVQVFFTPAQSTPTGEFQTPR